MDSWRKVFRDGLAPLLSDVELEALRVGLQNDDPRIGQGFTVTPPPLKCVQDWPPEGACLIGYAGWKGRNLQTVGEVEEFFARMCFEIDMRLGDPAVCRFLLNWYDETPRGEVRRQLIAEVNREQARRLGDQGVATAGHVAKLNEVRQP